VAATSEHHIAAHERPTAAVSPNGAYEARVVNDEQGTRIDVTASGHPSMSIPIAAPDSLALVPEGKALSRAVAGVPLTIAWSPDSKYLAYGSITGAPWALNLFSTASWSLSSYRVEGGYVGELSWSPDGSRLAISTYELERTNHTVLLLDVDTHWLRRLIGGSIVVWSPDGRFVAVHREPLEEPGVWIAPIEGGAALRITADAKSYPVAWTQALPVAAHQ
jgi:WD40 repeat protein